MCGIVFGAPIAIHGDVINVGRVLRVAPPRVADIVKIIRPEDVPAKAPSGTIALVGHVHGAEADVIYGANIPAQMMQPRTLSLSQRNQVMIAAMNAVHECDAVAGTIRQPQAENALVECNAGGYIRSEDQDMGKPPGADAWRLAPVRRSLRSYRRTAHSKRPFLVG